jgi:hypothetical protein
MNAVSGLKDLLERILAVLEEASVQGSSPSKADRQLPLDNHLSTLHCHVRTALSSTT